NNMNSQLIHIQNLNISGEQKVSYLLKNNILLISNSESKNKYNVDLTIDKQKNSKIKNKSGKITRYNLSLSVNLKLTNIEDEKLIQKTFLKSVDYEVAEIHSNTIRNENNAIKSATQQISDDIINLINLSLRQR
ncbi:LPS assembly lipoprotein LptE, partial [Pelagibacteraceae bacterium]|nr:LPS assembly lipoprotein LptE [Pelagibacteraceae bacterium]